MRRNVWLTLGTALLSGLLWASTNTTRLESEWGAPVNDFAFKLILPTNSFRIGRAPEGVVVVKNVGDKDQLFVQHADVFLPVFTETNGAPAVTPASLEKGPKLETLRAVRTHEIPAQSSKELRLIIYEKQMPSAPGPYILRIAKRFRHADKTLFATSGPVTVTVTAK